MPFQGDPQFGVYLHLLIKQHALRSEFQCMDVKCAHPKISGVFVDFVPDLIDACDMVLAQLLCVGVRM